MEAAHTQMLIEILYRISHSDFPYNSTIFESVDSFIEANTFTKDLIFEKIKGFFYFYFLIILIFTFVKIAVLNFRKGPISDKTDEPQDSHQKELYQKELEQKLFYNYNLAYQVSSIQRQSNCNNKNRRSKFLIAKF